MNLSSDAALLLTNRIGPVDVDPLKAKEYWSLTARLNKDGQDFDAKLHHTDGKAVRLGTESQTNAEVRDAECRREREADEG